MGTPHISWDWQPAVFGPPFTVELNRDSERPDITVYAKHPQIQWIVVRARGDLEDLTDEFAQNLLALVEVRYGAEVLT